MREVNASTFDKRIQSAVEDRERAERPDAYAYDARLESLERKCVECRVSPTAAGSTNSQFTVDFRYHETAAPRHGGRKLRDM